MKVGSALLVVSFLLAGCADSADGKSDALREAEKAAAALEVEATSTTGVIRGVVVDDAIRPIAGVTIKVAALDMVEVTNDQGAFGFEALEPGTYFLTASHPDYTQIQQSVDVVAGVDNPAPLRIQIAAIPRATPFVEALVAKMFVDVSFGSSYATGLSVSGLLSEHGLSFSVDILPNATVAQSEMTWSETTPLAEGMLFQGGTYHSDDRVGYESRYGLAPMIFRANATDEDGVEADEVSYSAWAWDGSIVPVGVAANQELDVFIHVFHHFMPREDWQFGRDGEHPIPS